jgi:peptidoglycan hydrolase-like protein with peptidoglycan-binding domain
MKRSLTAVIALAAAAGFAGLAQAQTTTTTTTAPSGTAPGVQTTAPNYQYQPSTAVTAPSAAPASPSMTPGAAPQASTQAPSSANGFWSRNISQDEVRQAQQQLQAQGLYRGPIDGKVGPEMQRALARFQRQNGLRPTGTLDERTMARLEGGATPSVGSSIPPAGQASTNPYGTPPASTAAPLGAGGATTSSTTAAPNSYGTQPARR